MSKGVNKVILIGNLGNDPEVRYTPTGTAVTTVSLATSETWKDKQSGEGQERTEWHRAVFFGRLAEVVGEYLKRGSKAFVEGSLRTRKWQDKNGQDRYTTEIVASDLQMLDSRSAAGSASNAVSAEKTAAVDNPVNSENDHEVFASETAADLDDDIPF